MIDPLDGRLLHQLQQDSRQSNQQLADSVGMSSSACSAPGGGAGGGWRHRPLYRAGRSREGRIFHVRHSSRVAGSAHEQFVAQFVQRIQWRAKVLECFATTGDADYHLRVVVSDMAAYNRFLDEFLFKFRGSVTCGPTSS